MHDKLSNDSAPFTVLATLAARIKRKFYVSQHVFAERFDYEKCVAQKKRNRLGGEWKGGIKSAERIRSGILWPSVRSVTLGWAANGKHESVYANRCNENSQLCKAAHFPLFSWFLMARKQSGRLDLWPPSRRNACSRCPVSCFVESLCRTKKKSDDIIWSKHKKKHEKFRRQQKVVLKTQHVQAIARDRRIGNITKKILLVCARIEISWKRLLVELCFAISKVHQVKYHSINFNQEKYLNPQI